MALSLLPRTFVFYFRDKICYLKKNLINNLYSRPRLVLNPDGFAPVKFMLDDDRAAATSICSDKVIASLF